MKRPLAYITVPSGDDLKENAKNARVLLFLLDFPIILKCDTVPIQKFISII